ncbi:hypothetical protein ABZ752_15360 [Streptomyces roseifaciens]
MLSALQTSRSPEEINTDIRNLLAARHGQALTCTERRVYERLRAEWLSAVRRGRCPQPIRRVRDSH